MKGADLSFPVGRLINSCLTNYGIFNTIPKSTSPWEKNMTFTGTVPTGIHCNPASGLYKIGGILHVNEWVAGTDFHQCFAFFLNPNGITWDVHNLSQEIN